MIPKKGTRLRKGVPLCSKISICKITEEEFFKFNEKGSNIKTFILDIKEIIPSDMIPDNWYELNINSLYSKNDKILFYYKYLDEILFKVDILKDDVVKVARNIANEYAKNLKIQIAFDILSTLKNEHGYNIIIKSSLVSKNYRNK